MAAATLASPDAAAAMDDRRNLELLIVVVVIHSLLRKDGANDDAGELKDMVTELSMSINGGGDQSAVSKELLLAVTQRLLDAQQKLRLAVASSSASDHQLMETAAAAKKKENAAAKKKRNKKMRNKRNKAAAKQKGGTKRMSWLGGGMISLLMMAATFGSSIMTLSHIPRSDGSSEGKAPPTLPPSTSTSLRQRDLQSSDNMASMSPSSVSPLAVVVQAPVFSPAVDVSNPPMNSVDEDEMALSTCFDTPNWENKFGWRCDWYEDNDEQGCPNHGSKFEGNMGVANDHCCYCGGGSHTLSPTISRSPSSAPSICNTPGWFDYHGYDCVWYEVMDDPGCPLHGDLYTEYTSTGVAKDNCCYCQNDVVSTLPPTKAPSSSGTCVDTPGWKNEWGLECDYFPRNDFPECPFHIGAHADNCCYCKDPTCEHFKWKCQDIATDNYWSSNWPIRFTSVCIKAASCSCGAADHFKIVTQNGGGGSNQTVGLYNECKCDFWSRLCEESPFRDTCDYAAEYCCGDYQYYGGDEEDEAGFSYLNSPLCYCDFFNYAQNKLGHTLKHKAINMNIEFSNPCGQFEEYWRSNTEGDKIRSTEDEKESLSAIYDATNGQNWKNNDGWMNGTADHCQWYGITCDDEGYVTSINLKDNNLVGQFPVYTRNQYDGYLKLDNYWKKTKYGLANLYKLKTLDLANNKLTGTIEYRPLYNLNVLAHFDVSGNQLSGEVEALVAPSLTHADFSNNSFTSMRRFQKFKLSPLQSLRYCDVSNNAIEEDATDILENIPPNIAQFIASNNSIYGRLPVSLNNLPNLRQFNMASNALSGELPGFTESFVTFQELDMSNQTNGFTGSIPENIWRSLSLEILNLADNRLTGTVPRTIGNMAVLDVFDLSNNRLDSSLPPELGMLEGSLKRLGLSNNTFTGSIPSQIGQLQGASVFLKDNRFHNSSTAPLSLCLEREVNEFDLADDTTLCPPERNALSNFYYSAKGVEWTDGLLWLDEYASYCDWKGVTCDDDKNHVTKLNLTNNGLSGRLSESIGNLTFIEVLDLSDNDIKGSIPSEIGLLENLNYMRLSYNAFTGAAPEGLGEMKGLQLLQLQSNRITEMPIISRLDNSIHGQSTFVTDCGVPSAFDEALECKNCTMCCNANDDCHPQEESKVAPLSYGTLAAVLFVCFIVSCSIVVLLLHEYDRHKNRGIISTMATETSFEDVEYALSRIGKDSVYSYFVTDKVFGCLGAFTTVGIQVGILVVFILASEANLQDDKIDVQFTWKCPRDTDVCENKADLNDAGWAAFSLLMIAFLAKDMISGCKLIYHSAKVRHSLSSRIRYFFGGTCLCWITLFALYVSTIYNKAIATSNTEIIVNSVIVLFVMELDEWIFSDLAAIDEKWTAHAEVRISDSEVGKEGVVDEMKEEIALHKVQIESQQEQIANLQVELGMLRELVEKIQSSQAALATTTTSDSESVSDCEGETKAHQMEQSDEITVPCDGEQKMQEPRTAADTHDSHRESDTEEDL